MGRQYNFKKVKYIFVLTMGLMINLVNTKTIFADQTTSNIGITFTGKWNPPTNNDGNKESISGNHMTVVSGEKPNSALSSGRLPQTGVKKGFIEGQLLGVFLIIISVYILLKKRMINHNEK